MAAGRKGDDKKRKDGSKKDEPSQEAPRKSGKKATPVAIQGVVEQIWTGPVTVTAYGSAVIKMVAYRKADNTVEWWGMCKGFRLGPSAPSSSLSRTFSTPASAPVITNVVEFVAWALPILQANNPDDPSFDWEICTIQTI